MKDKSVIRVKSQQLRRLRYFLRKALLRASTIKDSQLAKERRRLGHFDEYDDGNEPTQEERELSRAIKSEMNALTRRVKASIIICSYCNHLDRDMLYSKELNKWFCEECAAKKLEYLIEEIARDHYYC